MRTAFTFDTAWCAEVANAQTACEGMPPVSKSLLHQLEPKTCAGSLASCQKSTCDRMIALNIMSRKPIALRIFCMVVLVCACAASDAGGSGDASQIPLRFDRNGDGKVIKAAVALPKSCFSSSKRNAVCM